MEEEKDNYLQQFSFSNYFKISNMSTVILNLESEISDIFRLPGPWCISAYRMISILGRKTELSFTLEAVRSLNATTMVVKDEVRYKLWQPIARCESVTLSRRWHWGDVS
jgi:hypothetical protein